MGHVESSAEEGREMQHTITRGTHSAGSCHWDCNAYRDAGFALIVIAFDTLNPDSGTVKWQRYVLKSSRPAALERCMDLIAMWGAKQWEATPP